MFGRSLVQQTESYFTQTQLMTQHEMLRNDYIKIKEIDK